MNDRNPYRPPSKPTITMQQAAAIPVFLVRCVVGPFGGLFVAAASYVVTVKLTGNHNAAEILSVFALIAGILVVGWASYSRFLLVRMVGWALGGLGTGLVLEAIMMGGLGVGTFITFSGLVLGLVGALLGIRQWAATSNPTA